MQRFRVSRDVLISDLITGLVMALITIPGSLANGLLAGVNPVYGLYSTIAGTTVAALFTSSVFMNVDSTSATALATGEEVIGLSPEDQLAYIVVLGLLVGLFQLIFGFLKLGFLTRFISNAVMTGFLTGIGLLTIMGQVGDLTGFYSDAGNKVFKTIDTLFNISLIHIPTLVIGLLTMAIIFLSDRSRFRKYSYAIALVASTLLVTFLSPEGVATVGDTTEVPRTFISLHLPDLTLIPRLILPALSIAIIVLVQGSGVSQSVPNPDGEYPDPNGDFKGQGLANVATGFAGGIPVGGSLGGTAVITQDGRQVALGKYFHGRDRGPGGADYRPADRADTACRTGRHARHGRHQHGQCRPSADRLFHRNHVRGRHADYARRHVVPAHPIRGGHRRDSAYRPLRLLLLRGGAPGTAGAYRERRPGRSTLTR